VGELPLIGVVIGACLGGLVLFIFSAREKRKTKRTGHLASLEDRLPAGMIGGVLFTVTMFW
jgi:MFS transporter, DHA1 family, multidrug resistance protein